MNKEYVVEIDAGTESVRVEVYDLYGTQIAYGITDYKTYYPRSAQVSPGQAGLNKTQMNGGKHL